MQNSKFIGLAVALVILGVIVMSSFYTVREDKQALVLRFGDPVRTENAYGIEEDAGLKFKIPLIEEVRRYDRKNLVLDLDSEPFWHQTKNV